MQKQAKKKSQIKFKMPKSKTRMDPRMKIWGRRIGIVVGAYIAINWGGSAFSQSMIDEEQKINATLPTRPVENAKEFFEKGNISKNKSAFKKENTVIKIKGMKQK